MRRAIGRVLLWFTGAVPATETRLAVNIDARGAAPREIDVLRSQIPGFALDVIRSASRRAAPRNRPRWLGGSAARGILIGLFLVVPLWGIFLLALAVWL